MKLEIDETTGFVIIALTIVVGVSFLLYTLILQKPNLLSGLDSTQITQVLETWSNCKK